jgi:hypothetical protein
MSPEQARPPLDPSSDLSRWACCCDKMCAGASPFQGRNALETLNNVIAEPPRPIRERIPGAAQPLAALIDELWRKSPREARHRRRGGRPLRSIEAGPDLRAAGTEPPVAEPAAPTTWRPRRGSAPGTEPPDAKRGWDRWRRSLPWLLALGAAALAVALAIPRLRGRRSCPPLIVLVLGPRIDATAPDEGSRFAGFAVREAAIHALAGLEGVEAVDPQDLADTAVSVQDAARAVAADEVVTRLSPAAASGAACRCAARRRRRPGAGRHRILRRVSTPEDSLALANAVAITCRGSIRDTRRVRRMRARRAGRRLPALPAHPPAQRGGRSWALPRSTS